VGGLLGSGLGFGLKATLDNGEADGSSGRADGVAVYLKHGATLVLAQVALPYLALIQAPIHAPIYTITPGLS
jgi:hypothetical protein